MVQAYDNIRHFIYPLSLTGGYVFDGDKDISPENLVPDALRGATDTWGLATNFRVIEPGDWVWAYFGGKVRRIHAVGVVAAPVGYDDDWGGTRSAFDGTPRSLRSSRTVHSGTTIIANASRERSVGRTTRRRPF